MNIQEVGNSAKHKLYSVGVLLTVTEIFNQVVFGKFLRNIVLLVRCDYLKKVSPSFIDIIDIQHCISLSCIV